MDLLRVPTLSAACYGYLRPARSSGLRAHARGRWPSGAPSLATLGQGRSVCARRVDHVKGVGEVVERSKWLEGGWFFGASRT